MNILITGADRGLGLALTKKMLERGFTVFAGQYLPKWLELSELLEKYPETLKIIPLDIGSDTSVKAAATSIKSIADKLDMIIGNAGTIGWNDDIYEPITDTSMMAEVYNINTIGNVRLVEHFLPFLGNSTLRKICFVSSEAGSTAECRRDNFFWYGMTKAALNHYAKTLFNRYRKDDFKFRLYHPGWLKTYMHDGEFNEKARYSADEGADFAMDYFFDAIIDEDELTLYTFDKKIMPF